MHWKLICFCFDYVRLGYFDALRYCFLTSVQIFLKMLSHAVMSKIK